MSNPYQNVYNYTPVSPATSVAFAFWAGRFVSVEPLIRNVAWLRGCRVEIEVDRGWITHNYRVRLTGDRAHEAVETIMLKLRREVER